MTLLIPFIIYLYALALTGIRAWRTELITDRSLWNDREREFQVYEDMLKGDWKRIKMRSYVGSCMTTTLLPFLLQRLTRCDPVNLFKLFPCFIYSLTPVFIYFIARGHLNPAYSALASLYVLSTFYFLYESNISRVGVGLGFMSGAIYALLTGNTLIASVLVILVVLSHYGAAHYLLYILSATVFALFIRGFSPDVISVGIVLAVHSLTMFIWYRLVFWHVGIELNAFVKSSVTLNSITLEKPLYQVVADGKTEHFDATGNPPEKGKLQALIELEHRDPALQVAFGRTMKYFTLPQWIEFILSWLTVVLVMAGLILSTLWLGWTLYIVLSVVAFSSIVIAIAIPHVSIFYGVVRTYSTALILLAPCFAVGVEAMGTILGINEYALGFIVVLMYALCVSKILKRLWSRGV